MSYLLLFITFISYGFIQTFADIIDIPDSSYKLSTDIKYAIFHTVERSYIKYHAFDADFGLGEVNVQVVGGDPKNDDTYQWYIEETKTGYALKNVNQKKYLGAYLEENGWGASPLLRESTAAYDNKYLAWTFENTGTSYDYSGKEKLPILKIMNANKKSGWGDNIGLIPLTAYGKCCCGHKWKLKNVPEKDCSKSSWVFVPLSLPKKCGSITTDPSTPDYFRSLTSQLDSTATATFRNGGSTDASFSTTEKEVCRGVTTTFSRTDGSENSYGFSVAYESPKLSLGGVGLGSLSGDYHMDWKYYSETTKTKETEDKTCVTLPSTEVECPPRTTCQRIVTTYKPPVGDVEITITATCEGNQYTTKGIASVDGIVRIEYMDQMIPMDCKYYTTDYNIFKQGTLQFCDTCNNDKICEICRDGYILLDGVCITGSTCENICGGEVRGGDRNDGTNGNAPWSGGSCRINNHVKYLSNECRKQLGGASTTQSNTTPSPSSAPTDNNHGGGSSECVNPWEQCGGIDYKGPITCCNDGREYECQANSEWWSQCNPK